VYIKSTIRVPFDIIPQRGGGAKFSLLSWSGARARARGTIAVIYRRGSSPGSSTSREADRKGLLGVDAEFKQAHFLSLAREEGGAGIPA